MVKALVVLPEFISQQLLSGSQPSIIKESDAPFWHKGVLQIEHS